MIKVGIIGAAGYTAGELIRILLNHPQAEISFAYSKSNAGKAISTVHDDLVGETDLHFTDSLQKDVDVLFLCMGHGQSKVFLAENEFPKSMKIIDLSHDFRLEREGNDFVYGLPEFNKEAIKQASHIANCGCFATAIQLALLPLAKHGLLQSEIHVTAITGSTGAGQSPGPSTHFSWRNNNLSVYKAFEHQHLGEIRQSLAQLQPGFSAPLHFIPLRGDFARGIFASVYTDFDMSLQHAYNMYEDYYKNDFFTVVTRQNPHLKQVVNTNKCLLHLIKHDNKLLIISIIDNLIKGASGQAVQNMNLLFGLDESMGLHLKPLAF
jgi:N-acetyl-gamma-glutamyl-phosphate reductase